MKFKKNDPPRQFEVSGAGLMVKLFDCGTISLDPDEQVTFTTDQGSEYDVVKKSWGFYATPSTNKRLISFGLRTGLVYNKAGRLYVVIVECGKEENFYAYLIADRQVFLTWLDNDIAVNNIVEIFKQKGSVNAS